MSATAPPVGYRQWELENNVKPTSDVFSRWDLLQFKKFCAAKPWRSDPRYFKRVYISSLALIKVLAHAKTGKGKAGVISHDKDNWVEVMGMLQGYAVEECIIITDAFALPVEGKEVEVRLDERSEAYLVNYTDVSSKLRPEGCVGWYHSHPGLHSFMSATDCRTQRDTQRYNDPWCALVIDPVKSLVTGSVDFGVFRTLPEGCYNAEDNFDLSAVPLSKIKEYGHSFREYYKLDVTVYRSETDAKLLELLWSQYCISTLSASPLVVNRRFIDARLDKNSHMLDEAIEKPAQRARTSSRIPSASGISAAVGGADSTASLAALMRATSGTAHEVLQGVLGMAIKEKIFTSRGEQENRTESPLPR